MERFTVFVDLRGNGVTTGISDKLDRASTVKALTDGRTQAYDFEAWAYICRGSQGGGVLRRRGIQRRY